MVLRDNYVTFPPTQSNDGPRHDTVDTQNKQARDAQTANAIARHTLTRILSGLEAV